MKLSAPIYHLKRQAKLLAREQRLALHQALDRIASREGYGSWSLLAARHAAASPAERLYQNLRQGDLVLLGARPGRGKTLLALQLLVEAARSGHRAVFFTLEYTHGDIRERFDALGVKPADFSDVTFDCSDAISADHIITALNPVARGTFAVVDYLQLLDQRRENPPLSEQVAALKLFAKARGVTIVFLSQIDRAYDPSLKQYPGLQDIRLPNPLDLTAFDKACFLNDDGAAALHMPA